MQAEIDSNSDFLAKKLLVKKKAADKSTAFLN
jgi:hypothetical protein